MTEGFAESTERADGWKPLLLTFAVALVASIIGNLIAKKLTA